jgi:hypothetical protein
MIFIPQDYVNNKKRPKQPFGNFSSTVIRVAQTAKLVSINAMTVYI